MDRQYGQFVGSSFKSIHGHIEKHNLGLTLREYLQVGDVLAQGQQGVFSGTYNGQHFTAVVQGRVCELNPDGSTRIYGLLRSVRRGSSREVRQN